MEMILTVLSSIRGVDVISVYTDVPHYCSKSLFYNLIFKNTIEYRCCFKREFRDRKHPHRGEYQRL